MAFISFSCYKTYFYFLIYWLLDLSITIVRDLYLNEEIADPEYLKGTEFIYISCLNLADLFAGFLVWRTYRKMRTIEYKEEEKKKKSEKQKSKLAIELIYNDLSIREHKFSYIIFISALEFIARCTDIFYILFVKGMPIRIGEVNWLISIDFFSRMTFSRIFLKTKYYKHHFWSLAFVIIGLFSMSICAFMAIAEHELNNWPYFLFVVVKYILLPLEDVFNKILLTDQFLLPHYLMFWRGLFDLIFLIIFGCIVLIPGFVQFHYFDQFKTTLALLNQAFMKILFTIFSFCKAFLLLKVLDIFSPQHVAFCNTAFSLYQLIKCRIKSEDNVILIIVDAIFLVVIIFSTLVYNEFLIVNACGFNKNTKKAIIKKEKLELQDIQKDSYSDDEDSEEKEEELDEKDEKKDDNEANVGEGNNDIEDRETED